MRKTVIKVWVPAEVQVALRVYAEAYETSVSSLVAALAVRWSEEHALSFLRPMATLPGQQELPDVN
jgi:hypothetical protein